MEVDLNQSYKELTLPTMIQTSNPKITHGIDLRPVSILREY